MLYRLFLIIIIGINTICYGVQKEPSPVDLDKQLSSFNNRMQFYKKCIRRSCTIEERTAAFKASLYDGALLATLVGGSGWLIARYSPFFQKSQKQSTVESAPLTQQELLFYEEITQNINSKNYPIKQSNFDNGTLEINTQPAKKSTHFLLIQLTSDTINYEDITPHLNVLLQKIFVLQNPFNKIFVQMLGKNGDAYACRFEYKDNNWIKTMASRQRANETTPTALPIKEIPF